ncbi:MAG: choice-of-anchor D domain-containing protein [Candidatus Bipolaricaulota bacterium]|nr:choice-of-anchor D domain-containing protein [Candidatus Bipolaricaulota bacterium]
MSRVLCGAVLVGLVLSSLASETLLVVINEFGQGKGGNGEWVELLVVGSGSCSTVDLRGWRLKDYQGNAMGGVWVVFASHPVWQAVPAGTLIVIYNAGDTVNLPAHFPPYPDTDFSDFLVVLPHNHALYFAGGARWDGLANTGDWVVLEDAAGRVVDGLSYGNSSGQTPHLKEVPARRAAAFVRSGLDKINDSAHWVLGYEVDGTPLSTPGAGNSGENASWIASLRPTPRISVSPTALEFGNVPVGQEAALSVTVSNTGCASLSVGTVSLTGPHAAEFLVRNDAVSGATIPPGGSRTLEVVFRPASAGAKTATLRIPSNDPQTPVASVSLSGTGVAPQIAVSPLAHDFGAVRVGQESAPLTVTVRNVGTAPLSVGTVSLTGPHAAEFLVRNDAVSGATIPPGGSRTLEVVFRPVSVGAKTATLRIPSDDPQTPVASVSLSGTGAAPQVSVTPLSHDFGVVLVGQESAPLLVTVRNVGSAPLAVGTVALAGAHAAEFQIRNDHVSGATIPVGEARTLQVVFKPVSAGDKTATLLIPSDDPASPLTEVSLSGTGQPGLSVSAGGPYRGVVGIPVTLRATASGGFSPYAFAWDLDQDGEYDDASGAEVTWTWFAPGTYTLGVQARDSQGYTATDRTVATIAPARGDVNGDGRIDLVDLRLAYQAALGLVELPPEQRERADVDADGDVDLRDVELLCRWILGGCG